MGNRAREDVKELLRMHEHKTPMVPLPSASYRRRAWLDFQRALDPLAPPRPLPPPRA